MTGKTQEKNRFVDTISLKKDKKLSSARKASKKANAGGKAYARLRAKVKQ